MRGAQVPSQRKGVREPPVTFRTLQPLGASRSVRRHTSGPYAWQRDQTIADGREHTTEVLHQSPLRLRHQLSLVLEPQLFPSEPLHRKQQSVSHSGCLVPPGSGIRLPQSYTIPLWHTIAPAVVDHLGAGVVRRASLATENVAVAYRSSESAASGEVIRAYGEATGPSTVPAPQCHQSRPSRGPRFPRTACRTLARIMREQNAPPPPRPSLSEREGAVPEQRAGQPAGDDFSGSRSTRHRRPRRHRPWPPAAPGAHPTRAAAPRSSRDASDANARLEPEGRAVPVLSPRCARVHARERAGRGEASPRLGADIPRRRGCAGRGDHATLPAFAAFCRCRLRETTRDTPTGGRNDDHDESHAGQ